MIGLTLSSMLELKAKANQSSAPGWGKAKSIIMVYLRGGPSHLDLWDPKKDGLLYFENNFFNSTDRKKSL